LDEAAAAKAAVLASLDGTPVCELSMAEAEAQRLRAEVAELRSDLTSLDGTPVCELSFGGNNNARA
jgi:hypothetical protein